MDVILGIEADATVHDKQAAEWEKHAIKTFKVETMNEAIRYLLKNDAYFFITINADSIPHFLAQLPILSDITALPIIVYSKNISFKKRIEALDLGADAYERLYANPAKNISCFMNTLKVLERRMQRPLNPLPLLISGEVILSLSRRRVFIKDIEIIITSQEFNILKFLMQQPGVFISSEEILRNVWNGNFESITRYALWSAVKRLRKKLRIKNSSHEYITSNREAGYCFNQI